jgi:hypothetical protein
MQEKVIRCHIWLRSAERFTDVRNEVIFEEF